MNQKAVPQSKQKEAALSFAIGVLPRLAWVALMFCAGSLLSAQDLSPRAYVITPTNTNVINLTYSYSSGSLEFDGAVPISGATATIHTPIFSYYRSLSFFGRSANFEVVVPYGVGNFNGIVLNAPKYAYRSGLLDSFLRISINLRGGPAMNLEEFQNWHQKMLLGASLKIVAPTGQYDPTRLINWGNNRWAFKPEFGYSQRWGHWVLDAYAAAWFFTVNQEFFSHNSYFPGLQTQSESPVVGVEGHLSYDIKPRLWISLDANFWHGGATSINGVENSLTEQKSSRVGITASIPLTGHQSVKFSFADGAYISYGGNYKNASAGWQYAWAGWSPFSRP